MSSGKKILSIFFLLLLLAAIPVTSYLVFRQQELRSRASPATTVLFDPLSTQTSPLTKAIGETFSLNIVIDTGSNFISGAELHIKYDTAKLTGISIVKPTGAFLPITLKDGTISNGLAFIALGTNKLPDGSTGQGTLATITFRATASTDGAAIPIQFTDETAVAAITEGGSNVLVTKPPPPTFVKINTVGPTNTPTPTAIVLMCIPSDCSGVCASGATCRQNSSSATKSCSCQFPTTPTPTPTKAAGGITLTPTPTKTGNVGIGKTSPTSTPIAVISPTVAKIPKTGATEVTTMLTAGGIILFVLGASLLLIF